MSLSVQSFSNPVYEFFNKAYEEANQKTATATAASSAATASQPSVPAIADANPKLQQIFERFEKAINSQSLDKKVLNEMLEYIQKNGDCTGLLTIDATKLPYVLSNFFGNTYKMPLFNYTIYEIIQLEHNISVAAEGNKSIKSNIPHYKKCLKVLTTLFEYLLRDQKVVHSATSSENSYLNPLVVAIENGKEEMAFKMINRGANLKSAKYLSEACKIRLTNIAVILIQKNANIFERYSDCLPTPMHCLFSYVVGPRNTVSALYKSAMSHFEKQLTSTFNALNVGLTIREINAIIGEYAWGQEFVSPHNDEGNTPLHLILQVTTLDTDTVIQMKESIQTLLKHGGPGIFDIANARGHTPLHEAAQKACENQRYMGIFNLMIESGANRSLVDGEKYIRSAIEDTFSNNDSNRCTQIGRILKGTQNTVANK